MTATTSAGARRGRKGRRCDLPHRRHAGAVRGDPDRLDEHLDDHQRHRAVAAGPLYRGRRRAGRPARQLQGTTQNDIIKEYLARGSYVFPPDPSLRLTKDMILFCAREAPKWNPMNVCSYHLQEAGATPVQELSYALATAVAVLERVRQSGEVDDKGFANVVGSISFFVNAGMRFITELAKMRAFVELWDEITRDRFGVDRPVEAALPLRRVNRPPFVPAGAKGAGSSW